MSGDFADDIRESDTDSVIDVYSSSVEDENSHEEEDESFDSSFINDEDDEPTEFDTDSDD